MEWQINQQDPEEPDYINYSLDISRCVSVVFSKGSLFFPNFAPAGHRNKKTARQRRVISIANGIPLSCTPAVCYVYCILF